MKRTSNVPLGPQSPPSSPKSPGCRSRSGTGGPVVASPASSCSSSQRWTRARTKALVGTPLRRLWRRRRAWAPSSRRTDIDFLRGPISARTLHEPTSTRHRPPRSGARAPAPRMAPDAPARPSRAPPDAAAPTIAAPLISPARAQRRCFLSLAPVRTTSRLANHPAHVSEPRYSRKQRGQREQRSV